jgi:phosphoribosylaminoimidazole-succinocarboxamide synthase
MPPVCLYSGKVRNVYEIDDRHLMMVATDKVSSFDRPIGIIPGKGELLNKMSDFWFNNTRHIINNHLLSTDKSSAFVKRCKPIMIEMVVRGYITGNTNTSLWTHYNKGDRVYCGITFPDGLKKNQKLDSPVVTPTTKGVVDKPITPEEIVTQNYMTEQDYNFVKEAALELFAFGQKVADAAGFILVDTKYEFGKTNDGEIILIDEVHTCDSSRYWLKETYNSRMYEGFEPDKLDKDCIRDWVKSVCDPYKDEIPEVPQEIVEKAYNSYKLFYDKISAVNMRHVVFPNTVVILSGSDKDATHVSNIISFLNKVNPKNKVVSIVASAHKNTQLVMDTIKQYDAILAKVVYITVAGRSNALSGVVAANSTRPVIACPPFADKMDMMVNINSTLQCPSYVPVITILEPINVALAVERMFLL